MACLSGSEGPQNLVECGKLPSGARAEPVERKDCGNRGEQMSPAAIVSPGMGGAAIHKGSSGMTWGCVVAGQAVSGGWGRTDACAQGSAGGGAAPPAPRLAMLVRTPQMEQHPLSLRPMPPSRAFEEAPQGCLCCTD